MMIQFPKDLMEKVAQRGNDAPVTDALIELDDSVLDQIGGGEGPLERGRAWSV
jgi:hypothetical protein